MHAYVEATRDFMAPLRCLRRDKSRDDRLDTLVGNRSLIDV